jgi:hypothetical protein
MPSPAETETTPTLKHLNKFVRDSSVDYDIDGFVDEMRREKHNTMFLGDEGFSVSGDSDVEEKPDTKKPHSGARRPTGTGRTPANWIPPIPGLVELPATRLRNRQQKEQERMANETTVEPPPSTGASKKAPPEMVCLSLMSFNCRLEILPQIAWSQVQTQICSMWSSQRTPALTLEVARPVVEEGNRQQQIRG